LLAELDEPFAAGVMVEFRHSSASDGECATRT
jgi:hypothetical protein